MKENLVPTPEDNIYLQIQIKLKDSVASSCNCLCFIYFVLNIASVVLVLNIIGRLPLEVVAVETAVWLCAVLITVFMCSNCSHRSAVTIYGISIALSCLMPFTMALVILKQLQNKWSFFAYLVFSLARFSLAVYLIAKMKVLRSFNREIDNIKRRIKKLKRRKKEFYNEYPKVVVLEKLIPIDEEITFQYSCGSASPTGGGLSDNEEPVSYTHLTLPTICSV
eukprot:TRINITY_DN12512_c0_g1_i11.p1 TRINITY_DN12512_c0_g1~~TRINITY_DN12512_c0_g1_i11.p1  ORF type:complete len:222 (-),score=36.16 TRINITY_DN12512_c0_g1_i11:18-683(-)